MKEASERPEPYFLSDSQSSNDDFGVRDSVSQAIFRISTSANGIGKPFVIGLFGLACQRVETQWLHPVLGQISQPQIIQNAFSFGGGEAFIAEPHLLEAIHSINTQQLQNLVRSVSSNIQQAAHNIADDKMIYFVRSAFALVPFARRTGTGVFFNLSEGGN